MELHEIKTYEEVASSIEETKRKEEDSHCEDLDDLAPSLVVEELAMSWVEERRGDEDLS